MEGLIAEFGIWKLLGAGIIVFLFVYGFTSKGSNSSKGGSNNSGGNSSNSSNNSGGEGGGE